MIGADAGIHACGARGPPDRGRDLKGITLNDLVSPTIQPTPARLVRGARAPQPAVAGDPHPVPGVDLRGDAAADSSGHGDSVLRAFHGALSRCGVTRRGAAG